MRLENYFDFLSPDDIRIQGHRIGIDNVIEYYLDGYSPEEIAANFPGLSIERIYAILTYYHHKRAEIDTYLLRLRRQREQHYQQWAAHPSSMALRMRAIKPQREKNILAKQ
ncbi:MAG: hypothetical protein BRC45_01040 [Cyanobacteria bacterium QS_5_48_63]|nr:MAG: hypothetical protein BRC45_01040 [Cyanobacteria bacterium QS_5_48_63]